jgi:hypothetical protein
MCHGVENFCKIIVMVDGRLIMKALVLGVHLQTSFENL